MPSFLAGFLTPNQKTRAIFFFLGDAILICASLYLSFVIRFEFSIPQYYEAIFFAALPLFVTVKISCLAAFRLYQTTWRYVGLNDLSRIILALVLSELLLIVFTYVPMPSAVNAVSSPLVGFPRSVFLIDFLCSLISVAGLRISKRVFLEVIRERGLRMEGVKTLVIGAGNTGEMVLRDILKQRPLLYDPVGMLDDDANKVGSYIHGVRVIGLTENLDGYIRHYGVEALIIAIPSLSYPQLRTFYNTARSCNVHNIKMVPRIYDFRKPEISIKSLEDIRIEDLIGRQAVRIDYAGISQFLGEKRVLVTGAGGSIGSEIVTQLCSFHPSSVILFDVDETDLHNMDLKLRKKFPEFTKYLQFVTGDIRDIGRLREVFERYRPQIVFHAAAYKHVPMTELNPKEAVKVNIYGTENLVQSSISYGVEKFIMISTDKAVMPTSIMGATKRMAEYICSAYTSEVTEFISVRFGNVLGSRGSVLPLFMEQLKSGGPLTVTHPDMKRYFMTIPEAVSLVLQAAATGKGGEILVLDMGEPIRIVSLAEDLIRMHGYEPYKDVNIEFTGIRRGEKLFEEILTAEEGTDATKHEKIFIARKADTFSQDQIVDMLSELNRLLVDFDGDAHIKDYLRKYVKHYSEQANTV